MANARKDPLTGRDVSEEDTSVQIPGDGPTLPPGGDLPVPGGPPVGGRGVAIPGTRPSSGLAPDPRQAPGLNRPLGGDDLPGTSTPDERPGRPGHT